MTKSLKKIKIFIITQEQTKIGSTTTNKTVVMYQLNINTLVSKFFSLGLKFQLPNKNKSGTQFHEFNIFATTATLQNLLIL